MERMKRTGSARLVIVLDHRSRMITLIMLIGVE
jgi:hypothetical protein